MDVEGELTVTLAHARMQLREVETKIAANRQETDFYRRMGFGREVKDIELVGLEDEKRLIEARLAGLTHKRQRTRARKQPLISWLLLPVLFVLLGIDAIAPKRRTPRERFLQTRWRPQPRVSFDMG